MEVRPSVGAAPRRAVIERRRLLDRLLRRFEVRVTLVVGGAGSGKTTLLAQAMSSEHDHLDVWVPCRVDDRTPERLYVRILEALVTGSRHADEGPDESLVDRIGERVLAASPRQVCLVFDDVHLLGASTAVDELLHRLPANGHVLLAGRARPSVELARWDAAGELEDISQDELLMSDDEVVEFANLRGIDVSVLERAGGWPAFVELATSGVDSRSLRYLDEQALSGIGDDRRRALAAFAFIGGGDDEIARAATAIGLDELLEGVPLVRWSGEVAQLHDLWTDLLADLLDDDARRHAANAAAEVARERRDVERAIELGRLVGDWQDVAESLRAAVRDGVDGGLRADQIRRWRSALPGAAEGSAIGVLLDGILERERDPTAPAAATLLDRAATMFQLDGEPELELVALSQLGYVVRIVGDTAAVDQVGERLTRLADRYPPARPFTAISDAWSALTRGDPESQLAALRSIDESDLPSIWRITRRHLLAHALFGLGRAHEALALVPEDFDALPVPIPGALATRSQCTWYAGRPEVALADPPRGNSDRHGARDQFIVAAWVGLMRAYAGDVVGARAAARQAAQYAGERTSPLVSAQLVGLDALIAAADHDDDTTRDVLEQILTLAPLDGIGQHLFRHQFVFPYVLVPGTRQFFDQVTMADPMDAVRRLVQAFVAAHEDDDLGPLGSVRWPEPGLVAAFVPNHWAMPMALHGVRAGRHEARHLAAWLCEHWQQPARQELARWVDDAVLGGTARDVAAHTPTPPPAQVAARLLGPTEIEVDGRATAHPDWRRERVRALLAWLALHPQTSRDQAAAALWPELDQARAAKNLRTTLNYLNGVLEPGRASGDATWYVRSDGQRLELHRSLDVDLRRFTSLVHEAEVAERGGHPRRALPLLAEVIASWRGDLAADLDYEWLDLERIHVRSRFVRSACRAAELFTATDDDERAIWAARAALDADPYHERSYLALVAAYRNIGDRSSARTIVERARRGGVDV